MVQIFKIVLLTYFLIFSFFSSLKSAKIFFYLNFEKKVKNYSLYIKNITFSARHHKKYTIKINKKFSSNSFFNQKFIKKFFLPTDIYTNALIKLKDREISLPINLKISNSETKSLFLIWNVRASIQNKKFDPVLYIKNQEIPLRGEILFITSPSENTLFFIRTDRNQVCASIKIDGAPVDLSTSCNDDKIYILAKKIRTVFSLEVSTLRITDEFVLPFVIKPEFMIKSLDKLVIVDPEFNKIISINASTGSLINNIQLGENISDIVFSENLNKFYISSQKENQIYILDENLQPTSFFNTNCAPVSLFLDEKYLYISGMECNTIFVYNILNSTMEYKFNFFSPYKILLINSNLFVSEYFNKAIAVKYPQQISASKEIHISFKPFKLASCTRRGWLYISSKNKKYIEVIDILKEKSVGKIELGAIPYDLKIGRNFNTCN